MRGDNISPPRNDRASRVGRAVRRSGIGAVAIATAIGLAALWLNWPASQSSVQQAHVAIPTDRNLNHKQMPTVKFTDVTVECGIKFIHENGARGERLLPETMGSGAALFDFDGDHDIDVLLVNSTYWPEDPRRNEAHLPTMALYRNDGNWSFQEVTQQARLDVSLYGMGVATGDYDADGDADLFVTTVGENRLYRNDHGRFTDVSKEAGVTGAADQWSTSAAWFDYNNDGRLDLVVANYVQWSRDIDLAQHFTVDGTNRAYGPPVSFAGTYPYLYRNDGDGHFTNVTTDCGLHIDNWSSGAPMAKSLGVMPIDLDADGWLDIIIVNDTVRNCVFHNEAGLRFSEIGVESGIAFDIQGQARGAMGIDAAQFRNDATMGVAVGNFANEMVALYVSLGDPLQYADAAVATGLGPLTRLELTFGIFYWDYDLDGRLDLLAANGHIEPEIQLVQESQQYEQPPTLFWNAGPGPEAEFQPVPVAKCGTDLCRPMVARGSAYGDLDGDGDLDVLLTANGQTPRVLRNDQQTGNHWLRLRLLGSSGSAAIGTRVELVTAASRQYRCVMPTRGYLSQSEAVITFGLGPQSSVDRLEIDWPAGEHQTISHPPIDRVIEIHYQKPRG